MDGVIECKVSEFRQEELSELVEVMKKLGIKVECELSRSRRTARLRFGRLPSLIDAERVRTRNAGRHKNYHKLPCSSRFDADTPCREFLAWQEEHTVAEGMRELDLTRSMYFRRLREMKERLSETEAINARRALKPEKWKHVSELKLTLGSIL